MSAVFTHDRHAVGIGVCRNRRAHVAKGRAFFDLGDAEPHTFIGYSAQAFRSNRAFANDKHATGVAKIACGRDDGDVDVENIAVFEDSFIIRHAVTNHVVERNTARFRVRWITWWLIAERGRDGFLDIDHIIIHHAIQFARGNTSTDVWLDEVQDFRGKFTRHAHVGNVGFGFDGYSHSVLE